MGGGMGGGMGGDAPYSSSYGNINDRLANARQPLSEATNSGNGTGNPGRVYMRQINSDEQMYQEFIKASEAMKPRIVQSISDGSTQLNFDLDMSNSDYNAFSMPAYFTNTLMLNEPGGIGDFDMETDALQSNISAGQFTYTEGSGDGGSAGDYSYIEGGFDPYSIDWLSYCDPGQNLDHNCNFSSGGGMGHMGR